MRFDSGSLTFTIVALQNSKLAVQRAGEEALQAAGEVLLRACKDAVGLRDHSLTDLANMGHPYARRHGSIRVHTDAPWKVHRKPSTITPGHRHQTDNLYRSTVGAFYTSGGVPRYEVMFDLSQAPYARFIVAGTRVMLPRDPLWMTANDPKVRQAMMVGIIRRLGKELRSQIGVRFGAGAPTTTRTATGFGGNTGSVGIR